MATFNELLREFNRLNPMQRAQFLKDHPRFAERLAGGGSDAGGSGGGGGTTSGGGGGANPPQFSGIGGAIAAAVPGGLTGTDGTAPVEEVPDDAPPMPTDPLPPGWTWVWNGIRWVPTEGEAPEEEDPQAAADKAKYENDLFALYKDTLEQFGFSGEAFDAFLKQSVKEDWNDSTFIIKMRQQDWYLANPLYAANINRSKAGGLFMSEGQVLGYAEAARKLARDFGYQEPSDAYIAQAIQGGMSPAEFEHRLTVQDRIKQFGGGVAMVYEALMGHSATDQDLYEVFDPEISRKDFTDRARAAEMRGRPLLLGLGIRPAHEQQALDLLGVTEAQAWEGYKSLADALPSVTRFAQLDQGVANDPAIPFDSFGALFSAIFEGGPQADKAREALELLRTKEAARFRSGGGAVSSSGIQHGFLNPQERASFS